MTYKLRALSLGAGVQSSTILLMACKGELPKPDLAIFADTGWESQVTYKHLDWLEQEAQKAGIPILRVKHGNIKDDLLNGDFVRLPFYCPNQQGQVAMGRRRCTEYYKLRAIRRELRNILSIKPHTKAPKDAVDLWVGISIDEASRANISRDRLVSNSFPLLGIKPMTRQQCQLWLEQNYNGLVVPKSSCIGCPFHSNREWQQVKSNNSDFDTAILVDKTIRHIPNPNSIEEHSGRFLHNSCQSLEEVDLRTPQEKGQLDLFEWGKNERIQLFGNMEI